MIEHNVLFNFHRLKLGLLSHPPQRVYNDKYNNHITVLSCCSSGDLIFHLCNFNQIQLNKIYSVKSNRTETRRILVYQGIGTVKLWVVNVYPVLLIAFFFLKKYCDIIDWKRFCQQMFIMIIYIYMCVFVCVCACARAQCNAEVKSNYFHLYFHNIHEHKLIFHFLRILGLEMRREHATKKAWDKKQNKLVLRFKRSEKNTVKY